MGNKMDLELMNLPVISVGEMVKQLTKAYTQIIKNGASLRMMPSVMLWGPPGVGKSEGIRELAKNIEKKTGKTVHVTDVRLILYNPVDLRGIPTANDDKTLAVWLKPKIFQMDESKDVINILFLDEISAAPQSVQAAAYQITLDRVVGEHKLPENCIVIAAGNRVTDKSVAYKMPRALANRLLHFEIKSDFESWKSWAIKNGIHEKVLGFLSFRQDQILNTDLHNDELAFATPRTWEMVSNILNTVNDDVEAVFSLIAGLVGIGAAGEFLTWSEIYKDLPDVEKIFKGKKEPVPESPDVLYALVSAMTVYASKHKDDLEAIENSINYGKKLPVDFSVVLLRNYLYIEEDYKKKLLKIPEFSKWLASRGSLLNGIE